MGCRCHLNINSLLTSNEYRKKNSKYIMYNIYINCILYKEYRVIGYLNDH